MAGRIQNGRTQAKSLVEKVCFIYLFVAGLFVVLLDMFGHIIDME